MKTQTQKVKLTQSSFFCEDCIHKDPKVLQERATVDFSEAKEEETECYYCTMSGMPRMAEVLFNGFPSCRECRKRRNVMNFVAKTNEGNQKVIVTQIGQNKDLNMTVSNASFHKHNDSTPSGAKHFIFDPKLIGPDQSFLKNQLNGTPRHNVNQSMALPNTPNGGANASKTRKLTNNESSFFSKKPRGGPLVLDIDGINSEETPAYAMPTSTNRGHIVQESVDFALMPNTTRHDRAKMLSGVDLFKVMKTQNTGIVKPNPKMSDIKVVDFFKKINENGIHSLKGNLLYSSASDGFSGRKFHQKCDKKSPIVILIQLDNGFYIGGFTYKGIDPKSVDVSDTLCGLFCTYDCKKIDFYPVNNNKLTYQPGGIAFGSPVNLNLDLDTLNSFYCNLELGYYDPNGKKVLFSFAEKPDWSKVIKEFSVYTFK